MMNSSPQPSHRRVPISLGSDIGGCSCNRSFLIATAFVGISKNSTRLEIIDFPMCGRYRLSRRKQIVEEYFDASGEEDWSPRYNIAPTQTDSCQYVSTRR